MYLYFCEQIVLNSWYIETVYAIICAHEFVGIIQVHSTYHPLKLLEVCTCLYKYLR